MKLATILTLLLASTAHAQAPQIINYTGAALTNVPANAAAASRTMTLKTVEAKHLALVVNLKHVAASAITITVRSRVVAGGLWGRTHSLAIAAGTVTLSPVTYSLAVAADTELAIEIPVPSWVEVQIVIGATGGGATDLISAQATGSAG
jgi:hypothetical protein